MPNQYRPEDHEPTNDNSDSQAKSVGPHKTCYPCGEEFKCQCGYYLFFLDSTEERLKREEAHAALARGERSSFNGSYPGLEWDEKSGKYKKIFRITFTSRDEDE